MLQHEFVDIIPANRREGTLYISIPYATVVHQCCCGCGTEVVTPLSPTDWKLVFDGETVSLNPSIGNWGFACESHYWISRSRVLWARKWTPDEIAEGRQLDRNAKNQFYADPGAYSGPMRRERAPPHIPSHRDKRLVALVTAMASKLTRAISPPQNPSGGACGTAERVWL